MSDRARTKRQEVVESPDRPYPEGKTDIKEVKVVHETNCDRRPN